MEKLPPSAAAPTTAKAMAELGAGLTVGDLLAGTVRGDAMPTELADMVRYIASRREAAAEVVDLGRIALMPENAELRPFVRVIGEMDGYFVEMRARMEFPGGPAGPKRLGAIR